MQHQDRKRANRRTLHFEPLDMRMCLAASLGWDGPGTGAASLSYYIGSVPASVGLNSSVVESAIESALDVWARVADITFTQTSVPRQADSLDFSFRSIDGRGGILAQAYFPDDVNRGSLAGDVQFDASEPWEVGNSRGTSAFDLVYVAVHEIGHALGLDHLRSPGSVLFPSVSPHQVFTALAAVDESAILRLYAPAATPDVVASGDSAGSGAGDNNAGDTTGDDAVPETPATPRGYQGRPRYRFGGWFQGGWFGGRQRSQSATVEALVAAPVYHNLSTPADVNGDGTVSPLDALTVVNDLNTHGPRQLDHGEGEAGSSGSMIDVNADGSVSAMDVLMVVNAVNHSQSNPVASSDVPSESDVIENGVEPTDPGEGSDESVEGTGDGTPNDEPVDEAEDMPGDETDDGSEDEPADESNDGGNDEPVDDSRGGCHQGRDWLFSLLDANEDSLLTEDEVPERLWEQLLPADADNDGALTLDEFVSALPRRLLSNHAARHDRWHT